MNRIFKALMCFVLILSIMQLGKTWMRRYEVEKASNKVDIIVEYNDFEKMVEIDKLKARTDIDIKWWLLQLKNYGATSVAIIEDTILSLIQQGEDVDAKTYRELKPMLNYLSENELRSRIQQLNLDNYDIVIQTSDKAIYNRIVKSFQTYYEEFLIDNFENQEVFYIILDSNQQLATKTSYTNNSDFESKYVYSSNEFTEGKLLSVGIGLDPNKVAIAKEVGLTIIPRLNVNLQSQTDKISAYKDIVREFELDPTIYISADKEVIGYPQRVSEFANYIREENMTVLLIETNVQRNNLESPGQETLIKELDNNNLAR